jgi:hemolysin III
MLFASTPRRPTYTKLHTRGTEHKPIFRGLLHAAAAIAIPFTACFSTLPASASNTARVAFYTFVASCFSCYSVSAIYHIGLFNDRGSSLLQRIDQACIFILTAGSYTPSALMVAEFWQAFLFLFVVWGFAFIGAWHVVLHNRLSWFVVSASSALPFMVVLVLPNASVTQIILALGGWISYALGFLFYVTTKPRLFPAIFGYHELFHLCVVFAGICTAHFNQAAVVYTIHHHASSS